MCQYKDTSIFEPRLGRKRSIQIFKLTKQKKALIFEKHFTSWERKKVKRK